MAEQEKNFYERFLKHEKVAFIATLELVDDDAKDDLKGKVDGINEFLAEEITEEKFRSAGPEIKQAFQDYRDAKLARLKQEDVREIAQAAIARLQHADSKEIFEQVKKDVIGETKGEVEEALNAFVQPLEDRKDAEEVYTDPMLSDVERKLFTLQLKALLLGRQKRVRFLQNHRLFPFLE